ncbi:MAG: hypothetical protein K6T83_03820 [Alicyclobacillus sp.]|nr:hypothetical protein [Alicyclobacillus sp.]
MIWVALVAVVSVVAIDIKLLRNAKRHEIAVYIALVVPTLAMSSVVSWHLLPDVHLLEPFDAVFGPVTQWLYKIL